MSTPVTSPLAVICRPIQRWLAFVGLTYLLFLALEQTGKALYEPNSFIFGSRAWFLWTGGFLGCLMLLVANMRPTQPRANVFRLFVLIFFSVVLLAIAVLLTGGFIDSPFSGAVSLYVGFFIAMIQGKMYRVSNWILVGTTVLCALLPYAYLYATDRALHVVNWHTGPKIALVRLGITIFLLVVTAWFGAKVSDKLRAFIASIT